MRQKVTITLDSEIAEKLRLQSIKKYGNSRSMSRLIEDLATGAAEMEQPETCSILGHRSQTSFKYEAAFNKAVEDIRAQLAKIEVYEDIPKIGKMRILGENLYFAMKEACEIQINRLADGVNDCWSCADLNGPVPKYETAGKNFELYATMKNILR